jgi:hypothetical protein
VVGFRTAQETAKAATVMRPAYGGSFCESTHVSAFTVERQDGLHIIPSFALVQRGVRVYVCLFYWYTTSRIVLKVQHFFD